ncbi:HAD family hydrolase [Terriglobus aquaticus]|uniref:HAD family hydrolase n=1 Tax=Terriglobus aquaticus TaxID=940139 RepID=A0ABW9KLH2_9BACT|nr:haloacid dehalogenase-like hydrolase [Terriglobus aquaticus]
MPETSSFAGDAPAAAGALTETEFLAAVRRAEPRIAVFDFDGTLWPGDAGSGFMDWSIETGLLRPERARTLQARHAAYHAGEVDEITICGEMVQIYSGIPENKIRDAADRYFREHVEPHLFPTMVSLVRELKAGGAEIWAVSSTNNWVIEAGVRDLGIVPDRVLAACIATENGLLTERLVDVPSDEKKAEALHRSGVRPDAVFGNSIHDLAMLEVARFPFAINPNEGLLPVARQRGWPVYFPSSSGPA